MTHGLKLVHGPCAELAETLRYPTRDLLVDARAGLDSKRKKRKKKRARIGTVFKWHFVEGVLGEQGNNTVQKIMRGVNNWGENRDNDGTGLFGRSGDLCEG